MINTLTHLIKNNKCTNLYRSFVLCTFFVLFFFYSNAQTPVNTAQPVKTRILFLLDVSGSMTNNWGNTNRFRASKIILSSMVDSLQKIPNVEFGLRVFGSLSPLNLNDCKDTRLEAPIRPNNANSVKSKLNNLQCKGITPIAYSLEQSANDFIYSNDRTRNIIVMITDGIESCNGDACEVSKRLQKKGIFLQPFIIGLGLTKEASATFDCVGRYDDAQDEIGFRKALKSVMNTVLNNTSTQVNLLDENGKATETNVPILFYDRNSGIARYQFIHTLNARGVPDTLQIDPVNQYKLFIQTTPPVEKDNIEIIPNRHNIINISAPQGDLTIQIDGLSTYKELTAIVRIEEKNETIDLINLNQKKKYLCGTYDLEILTLPRLTVNNVKIRQSETTTVRIPAPGIVTILNTNSVPVQGSIFVERGNELEWVCDINGNTPSETINLQPGNYRVVYKSKGVKRSMGTREEKFKISSGSSANIRF